MDSNLLRTKSIEQLVGDVEQGSHLKRTLTALDLTLLGIGAIIGTGIFVLTGTAAANQAGPAIMLSFIAGRAGLRLRGAVLRRVRLDDSGRRQRLHLRLRDARRAVRLDHRLGPHPRIRGRVDDRRHRLERLLPDASSRGFGLDLPAWMAAGARRTGRHQPAGRPHRAADHCAAGDRRPRERPVQRRHGGRQAGGRAVLHRGGRSATSTPTNWSPFAPYGWSGIMAAGAAVVFFAYIGFDAVSTTAEEAKNPQRDLPIGIIASLVICTVLYIAVAAVLTGIVPVTQYRTSRRRCRARRSCRPRRRAVPERAGGLRAVGDRAGLGRVPRVGRRRGRHHERAARHAA